MKVFIADYLPLANKGEEEILRGIESLMDRGGNETIQFSVFGDVHQIEYIDNITVFPKSLCYPDIKSQGKVQYLLGMIWAIMDFLGLYPYKKRFLDNPYLLSSLKESSHILIGHDGFFNIRCAILGNFLKRNNYRYGILGAGFNRPSKKLAWAYNRAYKKCFDNADFIILRERIAYDYAKSLSHNPIIKLFPDPAFFCPDNSYDRDNVSSILARYNINKDSGIRIGLTVCEDSISFSRAFINESDRVTAHRQFIADLIRCISRNHKCAFYFLPHCVKKGKGNDLAIAKDIRSRLDDHIECKVIEEDIPVLDLKCIISKMDILIGERTHSVINSIATSTPFVSLTCSADFRTHDIVGKGCGLSQQIYDMDYADINELYDIIDRTIINGELLKGALQSIKIKHELMRDELKALL